MDKCFYISVLVCFLLGNGYSQEKKNSIPNMGLEIISGVNQSDSYITFPTDIGNIEPLLFEANISPSFLIRKNRTSRLMGVLTAQVIIRMYNEVSYPIRTPSYIPQITFYYLTGNKEGPTNYTFFGKLAHHSNGQDGSFYNEEGAVNLQSGNFATNFIELGLIKTSFSNNLQAQKFFKSSLEIHPNSWMISDLNGKYSGFRWHNSFLAFKLPVTFDHKKNKKAKFSLKVETTYMMDKYNNMDTFDLDRINASFTFYYHPKFLEDIGLFVQLYHGMDYYNIYFNRKLEIIRFGIMTEKLRF